MATSSEKRALIFLAAIAALGVSLRAIRSEKASGAGSDGSLDRQIAAVDSATVRARGERSARKRASTRSRRDLGDSLELSGARNDPPPRRTPSPAAEPGPVDLYEKRRRDVAADNRAAQERFDALSKVITVTPKAPPHSSPSVHPAPICDIVDLDTADEATIATVPWIGPSLAARIVSDRVRRGTFGSLEGLQRVAGIGPGLTRRIASRVRFSGSGMGPTRIIRFRKTGP